RPATRSPAASPLARMQPARVQPTTQTRPQRGRARNPQGTQNDIDMQPPQPERLTRSMSHNQNTQPVQQPPQQQQQQPQPERLTRSRSRNRNAQPVQQPPQTTTRTST
ncbi:MAG: hypothetical protein ACKPKO_15280, partial [Candidatus Fonsibacter sp.]